MKLLIVDTETTGLDYDLSSTIEIAGCLYDSVLKSEIATIQFLLPALENPAEHINGISIPLLQSTTPEITLYGRNFFDVLYSQCDYVVAHNAPFDKNFLLKVGLTDESKPWICSHRDLVFPNQRNSGVLVHISIDHNLPPSNVHRALGDVQTLCNLLKVVPNLDEQILISGSRVTCTPVNKSFSMNDQLRNLNFKFDRTTKLWTRRMSPQEIEDCPFELQPVE